MGGHHEDDRSASRFPSARALALYVLVALLASLFGAVAARVASIPIVAYSPLRGLTAGFAARERPRTRWAFLAAAAVFVVVVRTLVGSPPGVSVLFAADVVVGCALFAGCLDRFWPTARRLDHRADLRQFLAAATVSVVVPVTALAAVLALVDPPSFPFLPFWSLRLLANLVSVVSVAPIVLLGAEVVRGDRWRRTELAAFGAVVFVTASFDLTGEGIGLLAAVYLPIVVVLVGVARLGRPAAAVLPLLIVAPSAWGVARRESIFVHLGMPPVAADLALQVRNLVVIGAAWSVWAVVADRARATAELETLHTTTRASEERFRTMFESSPLGIVVATFAGDLHADRVVMVNPALCAMTGFREEDLLGRPVVALIHPDDVADQQRDVRRQAWVPGRAYRSQLRTRRADGSAFWSRVALTPIAQDDGSMLVLAQVEDVTAEKRAADELTRRALHDELTGLANRHQLMDRIHQALAHLGRARGAVALVYVDIDHFKDINDTLGHEAGDRVLVEVGTRLRACVRTDDTAARLAGDEFVIVCPELHTDAEALAVLDRLQRALAAPIALGPAADGPGGASIVVTASLGLATADTAAVDAEELLRRADTAMYAAKRRGRNRSEIYDEALRHHALRRHQIERDLRTGLDQGWFRLLYQPIIDLTNGRIASVEALLRLQHPDQGLLAPDAFIDVAEDSELIIPIGAWVLDEACRHAGLWNLLQPLDVAVNLSARQTRGAAVTDQVVRAAAGADLDPAHLRIEVTERVLLEGGDAVVADLRDLTTNHHVSLAMDDFGTGYSSLTYLKRFPIDTVKIDRSFVAGVGANQRDTAIVQAVIALADSLGLTVIAEGIETPTQLAHLRRLGCRFGQGYHFSPPRPADAIAPLLRAQGGGAAPPTAAPAGPAFFTWSDGLRLGHRDIDAQHHEIFDLIDRIHRGAVAGAADDRLRTLLDDVARQTLDHFRFEESLMTATGYPEATAHRLEHERLLVGLDDLRAELDAHEHRVTIETARFLRDWFVTHLEELDTPLVRFLVDFAEQTAPAP